MPSSFPAVPIIHALAVCGPYVTRNFPVTYYFDKIFFKILPYENRLLPTIGDREALVIDQPYVYRRRELTEPDWRRFPAGPE